MDKWAGDLIKASPWWTPLQRVEHRGGRGIWTTPSSEEKGLGQAGAHPETDDLLEFVHFEKSLIRQPFSRTWAGCRTSYRGCCSGPGLTGCCIVTGLRGEGGRSWSWTWRPKRWSRAFTGGGSQPGESSLGELARQTPFPQPPLSLPAGSATPAVRGKGAWAPARRELPLPTSALGQDVPAWSVTCGCEQWALVPPSPWALCTWDQLRKGQWWVFPKVPFAKMWPLGEGLFSK